MATKAAKKVVDGYDILNRHIEQKPEILADRINEAMGSGGVVWRDAREARFAKAGVENRWFNLDFLGDGKARTAWKSYWPKSTNQFSWSGIGRVQMGKVGWEWLLVSAFANPDELEQEKRCLRVKPNRLVLSAMAKAQDNFKAASNADWVDNNFQLTSRLSALSFLRQHGVCVRMLSIYFSKTKKETGCSCSTADWKSFISDMNEQLGLTGRSVLERSRMYQMFLPAI